MLLVLICPLFLSAQETEEQVLAPGLYARFSTIKGELLYLLDYERLPLTVSNFVALAEGKMDIEGTPGPYYNGQKFFRSIEGYALFLGDPGGTGEGGVDYNFPQEEKALLSTGTPGSLMMVSHQGKDHGSRIMIVINGDPYLDQKYVPFGQLEKGEDVLLKLKRDDVVTMLEILRVGDEAMAFQPDGTEVRTMIAASEQKEREIFSEEHPDVAKVIEALGEGFERSDTGIFYKIVTPGSGDKPRPGDTVRMHYSGRMLSGQEFDNSYMRGEPFQFILGKDGVVPGWVETTLSMQPGEQRTIILPPEMGYGERGIGPIPPGSWLVFNIELIDFQ